MRHSILPLLLLAAIVALYIHGPIPQDPGYHNFIDQRTILRIPNFLDVVTNLPFLLIGVAGLRVVRHSSPVSMRRICTMLSIGFILLTFGSGWYHWQPDNFTLMMDRIPIAIIIASFFCIFIHDHIGEWYGSHALPILNVIGIGSVIAWYWSELAGDGDLRAYVLVQFFPVIAIPVLMLLYRSRFGHWRPLTMIYLFFILAKIAEHYDREIFGLLAGIISGHSLKHLFMALAGAFMVKMIGARARHRKVVQPAVLR